MMLGALSASLIFTINALGAVRDLHENIDSKAPFVSEARARIARGVPEAADVAYVRDADDEVRQVALKTYAVLDCVAMAALCILLVVVFAYIDRYHAFKTVTDEGRESHCRKWKWWYAVNIVGVLGFMVVLLYTKQAK